MSREGCFFAFLSARRPTAKKRKGGVRTEGGKREEKIRGGERETDEGRQRTYQGILFCVQDYQIEDLGGLTTFLFGLFVSLRPRKGHSRLNILPSINK